MERSFFQKPQRKDSLLFAGKDSMLAGSCVGKLSRRDAANGAVGAEGTIDHGIGPNDHIVVYLDGAVYFAPGPMYTSSPRTGVPL